MIHKRILDAAAADPDCSLPALAEQVSGATADLVERVLDEYGDPAAGAESATATGEPTADANDDPPEETMSQNGHTEPAATDATAESSTEDTTTADHDDAAPPPAESQATADPVDAPAALTERQRRTLRAVHEAPTASQQEIADHLDVTRATVSRRLNDIPGFAWPERAAYASAVFGANSGEADAAPGGPTAEAGDSTAEAAGQPADAAEGATAAAAEPATPVSTPTDAATVPPDLVHKVAHACLESEALSREEELAVLEALMDR